MNYTRSNSNYIETTEDALRIAGLISGYVQHRLNAAQNDDLDEWVGENDNNMQLFEELTDEITTEEAFKWLRKIDSKPVLERVKSKLIFSPVRNRFSFKVWQYAIAAAIVLLIGTAVIWLSRTRNTDVLSVPTVLTESKDLPPGREQATLTLDNGEKIELDQAHDGTLANEGNASVAKKNGQLIYTPQQKLGKQEALHILSTPRGGSYPVTLSDDFWAWLNAASSISFPAQFTGQQRKVAITGEVYFEVTSQKAKGSEEKVPFIVDVKDRGIQVEVLGTQFNINAYDDEPITKTTLLEGNVKIIAGGHTRFLKPNQQAQVSSGKEIKTLNDIDVLKTVAWKNGFFRFNGDDLGTIMRQVARWYNVDIEVSKAVSNSRYHFILFRQLPVSKLFEVLEETGGVQFETDGKKILIKPI